MSGTTISNLPSASSVGLTDLLPVVLLGSPNITQRGTVAQLLANAVLNTGTQTLTGTLNVTNPGTAGDEVVNISQFGTTNSSSSGLIHIPSVLFPTTLQYGNAESSGGGTVTVTFPYSFSAEPWVVFATTNAVAGASNVTWAADILSTSQCTFTSLVPSTNVPGGPAYFFWLAIGPT